MPSLKAKCIGFYVTTSAKAKDLIKTRPKTLATAGLAVVVLSVYAFSKAGDGARKVIHMERQGAFQGKRILEDAVYAVADAKEKALGQTANELLVGQKKLGEDVSKLSDRVLAMEAGRAVPAEKSAGQPASAPFSAELSQDFHVNEAPVNPEPQVFSSEYVAPLVRPDVYARDSRSEGLGVKAPRISARGPDVVTFPVASEDLKEELAVTLPVGSYVKAKIIAGTDATTGEPDPVLLQLDYANVLPNQRKLDLLGCFMTAKAQADLSTERVKMKTMKLSCVSKKGLVFERTVNGYVADDVDNKFGVAGPVNSKQDRVASMAFLAAVVEGVGKAVQQGQTTQQTTPLGGSQSVMIGDERKYLAGGAAANAAGVVTQWYLKQAENLLPSITAGSGKDVWIVVLDGVNLPTDYFSKGAAHDSRYSHVTRILD